MSSKKLNASDLHTSEAPTEADIYDNDDDVESVNLKEGPNDGPDDEGNVVYWIFLLYGVGVLLPWNAVLNAFSFFIAEVSGTLKNSHFHSERSSNFSFFQLAIDAR